MSQPDAEKVAAQLRGMQQDLRALEEALRQLTDALTEEEQAQLSPQAKAGLQRLRARTTSKVELLIPKEAAVAEEKKRKASTKSKKAAKSGRAKKPKAKAKQLQP